MALRSLLHHIDTNNLDLRQLDISNTASIRSHSCGNTHKGWVRFVNEDAFLELSDARLWAVADGMGGHKRGDYASNAVIKALRRFSRKPKLLSSIEDLQNLLVEANEVCQKAFRARRIGSTAALLFEFGGHCFFIWAGDSRIYRIRDGHLEQMTRDHSLAQEKFAKGELNQDEAQRHSSAHILTKAIGINRHLKLELRCSAVKPGDRYLLCSDGLYGEAQAADLKLHLSQQSQTEALDGLINVALERGGRDNITGIIVDFE
ncbi:MAG: protein phosphatase 2C domain-containing protein [Pseudomonadota bacterium]